MKHYKCNPVFLLSILAFLFLIPELSSAEVVGEFSYVSGRVDILRVNATAVAPVEMRDSVFMGDIVRTKSDGNAEIIFNDKTTIRLAPETRIKIDEYVFNPDSSRKTGSLSLFRGKVRAIVSKAKAGLIPVAVGTSTFTINTPTAIAGVRGTDFFVFYERGVTGVIFKEGKGFVYNINIPDRIVNIHAGEVTFVVSPDAPPLRVRTTTKGELTQHTKDTKPSEKIEEMREEGQKLKGDKFAEKEEKGEEKDRGGEKIVEEKHADVASTIHNAEQEDSPAWGRHANVAPTIHNTEREDSHGGRRHADVTSTIHNSEQEDSLAWRRDTDDAPTIDNTEPKENQGEEESASESESNALSSQQTQDNNNLGNGNEGNQRSNDKLMDITFSYGADLSATSPITWISVGETPGTSGSPDSTWQANQMNMWIETSKFLTLAGCGSSPCNPAPENQSTLQQLNIPSVEVGRATLSGSDKMGGKPIHVNMNDVIFFAYSNGSAPKIWATGNVSGTYDCSACNPTTVPLSGSGLEASFKIKVFDTSTQKWMAEVNGKGTLSSGSYNGSVKFDGAAAGVNTGPGQGTFSGTAAGVTK
ncbi:MAG: FecR family protein [Nitrospinota bacterium]